MNSKVINTKLGEIEYCSIGKGIPVLFIHGGHTNCNSTLWHKGFDLKKFQLIAPPSVSGLLSCQTHKIS